MSCYFGNHYGCWSVPLLILTLLLALVWHLRCLAWRLGARLKERVRR